MHVKLPLDQSVSFSASQYEKGPAQNLGDVHWTAENLGTHRPARISPDGVFTSRLPGVYKIKATSGRRRGFAIVAVPDGIRHDPNSKPIQCISVSTQASMQGSSSCPAGTPPALPEPATTGPGWQDRNFRNAFLIENHLGLDVRSKSFSQFHHRRNLNMDGGTGSGNYVLSIPILSLPGRGQNLSLTLFYNSKLWTNMAQPGTTNPPDMVFDHDQGWPAPGWSLGFGKVVRIGSIGVALEDPDGALHVFSGVVNPYADGSTNFVSTTSDGTLINCRFWLLNGQFVSGNASYPNGTIVEFGAPNADGSAIYPTRITDPNGNFTKIGYANNRGPLLDQIVDTVGRAIQFYYADGRLISVTVPGLGGGWRSVVRLHYREQSLHYGFASGTVENAHSFWAVDAIYFPGTQSGYWFGDNDSYSSYGMIAKVSQRRGMMLDIASGGQWAVVKKGDVTHEQKYNYPLNPDRTLTDAPTYTQMAETWAPDRLTEPALTKFAIRTESNMPDPCSSTGNTVTWQRLDTTYPDSTLVVQRTLMDQGYTYGALNQKLTYDPSGKVLRTVTSCYEAGDDQSARIVKLQITDELNQTRTTTFSYQARDNDHLSPNNQLVDRREIDYDGTTVLRRTHMEYVNGSNYDSFLKLSNDPFAERRILNLPSAVTIYQGEAQVLSRTEYAYDANRGAALINTEGVINHDDAYNPHAAAYSIPPDDEYQCDTTDEAGKPNKIVCTTIHVPGYVQTDYQQSTDYRGNATAITRYVSASDKTHPITETMLFDMDGNQIVHRPACCEFTQFGYTSETQYAYPTSIQRGAPPDATTTLTTLFTYDLNTGLLDQAVDANQLATQYNYDFDSLRPTQVTLLTPGTDKHPYVKYSYDDEAMTTTTEIHEAGGNLAGKAITAVNGLGKPTETRTLSPKKTWNATAAQYDAMGRGYRQSQPLAVGEEPLWNELTFDSLGRTVKTKAADGNQTFAFYNEATRPSSASTLPGQTVRTQDAMGRERWSRTDALGNLAEVVEPNAYSGSGSVSAQGNVQSAYSYNALGLLTNSIQGPDQQERDFSYDSLGRLTAEYLAEKSRTLDDNGNYIGANGKWSDVFSYDDRSNLVWHADARGIKTVYDYENDPLGRLQAIGYDLSGFGDTANPVLPAAPVYFSYVPDGDLTRVAQIAIADTSNSSQSAAQKPSNAPIPTPLAIWARETFTYDDQARLASKTLSYPGQDLPPLEINYQFDTLNRLTRLTYPPEYGTLTAERKNVDYTYQLGRLNDIKIDGIEHASQLAYNPAGQLTSVNIGPSGNLQTSETYDYDPATSLLSHQQVLRGNAPLLDLRYTYFGNRQVQETIDGSPGQGINYAYAYDNLGRIGSAQASSPSGSLWSESYTFDTYGNKLNVAASGHTLNGTPIPLDGVAGSPTPPNGLASLSYDTKTNHISTAGFAYDAAGNQTRVQRADGSWFRYQYDAAGRLGRVTDDGGKTLESYQYGADRHRFITTNGSGATPPKYYAWDRDQVLAEYTQPSKSTLVWSKSTTYLGNRLFATFAPGGSNELVQYQHPDRLGTRLITHGSDGAAMAQQTLPFGTLIPNASLDPINPIFTSYDRSFITGLDYGVNREYNSQEQFAQPDPLGMAAAFLGNPQSLNLYSYVGGDPLNGTDPSGLTCGKLEACQSRDHGGDTPDPREREFWLPLGGEPIFAPTVASTGFIDPSDPAAVYVAVQNAMADVNAWLAAGGDVNDVPGHAIGNLITGGVEATQSDLWALVYNEGNLPPQGIPSDAEARVWTLGLEGSLTLSLSYLGGLGVYLDTETGEFGLYSVYGFGPALGAGTDINGELGWYNSKEDFVGKGLEIGGGAGYGIFIGVNTSWDVGTLQQAGTAFDFGGGVGGGGYGLLSHTSTLTVVEGYHSSFDPFYPLGNKPFFGAP